ncbi:LOW QUALITY PROTEIN: hypothetical protein RJ639_033820 [Escallonia herrerae]|uniref:C2 domain-containing protein n=1 Tax=Escallonia herrerae TaxID=1293975 RepID=A0AA89B934_9ASTE|nr:LOW QUALITY PROTEIN: hypothetical protein RJ639_033820 [Escallonia herrerae]
MAMHNLKLGVDVVGADNLLRVVKARDLPAMDVTGSLDPYVEAKIGNYKGVTKHMEKQQNLIWNVVFAFSREQMQASVLEVVVKDKDLVKDDFVGIVRFDLSEVSVRVPPDSPPTPEWYRLQDKKGEKIKSELMLAVWIGTQADEAFPDAWHSDAASAIDSSAAASALIRVSRTMRLHLRVCLDGGYHVLDESTHYSSDLRPTAKQLWKPSIGVLELANLVS